MVLGTVVEGEIMSKVAKKGELRLAGVLGTICRGIEAGEIPLELIVRVVDDPWKLLRPGEVFERQHGELIPKCVNIDTVRVFKDGRIAGVRNDDRYWSPEYSGQKYIHVDQLDGGPFFRDGEIPLFLDADGNVRHLYCGIYATKILSRKPFVGYDEELESIVMDGVAYPFPFRFVEGSPVGALRSAQDELLIVWTEDGDMFCYEDEEWLPSGSFSLRSGETVHDMVGSRKMRAIVTRTGDGSDAMYRLSIYKFGMFAFQTEAAHYISTPIALDDGTMFVRIDDELWYSRDGKAMEFVCPTSSDPVCVSSGDGLVKSKVRVLSAEGTVIVSADGNFHTVDHAFPMAIHEPFLLLRKGGGLVQIRKYLPNGSLDNVFEADDAKYEKFFIAESGFSAVGYMRVRGAMYRWLVAMNSDGNGCWESVGGVGPSKIDSRYDADLQTLIGQECSSDMFVVARIVGASSRPWCVLGNHLGSMQEIGKAAHAIFCLRIDGPLLRWYRRDGRMITDCRMYIGE